jgi:hypothetical protein
VPGRIGDLGNGDLPAATSAATTSASGAGTGTRFLT